jgi:uncharacterized membrane protein YbhN (UPF0104 family)
MRTTLRHGNLWLCAIATVLLALVAAYPDLLGRRVGAALHGVAAADPAWLWAAGGAFVVMQLAGGLAWKVALGAAGAAFRSGDAVARYCVGSGVNAAAPAHLGGVVRIALFARATRADGAVWRVGGAGAAVGAVRSVWLGALVLAAAATGGLPPWPLVPLGLAAVAGCAALACVERLRADRRVIRLRAAFTGLGRSPRALLQVAALTGLGLAAKVAAATAACAALGVERPLAAALVLVPAVELAAVMPLTPGNIGVASAAVAVVLGAHGASSDTALATGIAFGAAETLAAAAVGIAGALVLSGRWIPHPVRWAAASACMCAIASTCALTVAG